VAHLGRPDTKAAAVAGEGVDKGGAGAASGTAVAGGGGSPAKEPAPAIDFTERHYQYFVKEKLALLECGAEGNCFFHSVLFLNELNANQFPDMRLSHTDLRTRVVTHLRDNLERIVFSDDQPIKALLETENAEHNFFEKYSKPGEYVVQFILFAFSHFVGAPVVVWSKDCDAPTVFFPDGRTLRKDEKVPDTIFKLWTNGGHYQALAAESQCRTKRPSQHTDPSTPLLLNADEVPAATATKAPAKPLPDKWDCRTCSFSLQKFWFNGGRNLVSLRDPAGGAREQSQQHGPFRHDDLFESLFEPSAFPHFFRVFEECDIELPSALSNSHTASTSDSAATIKFAITVDGFKKMAECYMVRNRVDQSQGQSFPSSETYSSENVSKVVSKFLKDNKEAAKAKAEATAKATAEAKAEATAKATAEATAEAKAAEAKAAEAKAAEAKAAEEQAQTEYNRKLMNLVLSLPQSDKTTSAKPKDDEAPTAATCWAVMRSVFSPIAKPDGPDRTDPFFSLCLWLLNHCTIPHKPPPNPNQQNTGASEPKPMTHKCRAEDILRAFSSHPDDRKNFEDMVTLVRFCHLLHFWHRDSFASKCQCIFELCYCSTPMSMFNLCSEKDATRSLQECTKLIERNYLALEARTPSLLTSRWVLLEAGRSVKQWGHPSSSDFEKCEVEKESNFCEKWRHLIYSYAIMSLLYSEFNGNKQGPIGNYDFREKCKIGSVGSSSQKFVYSSKATSDEAPSEASDYLGHNIVALAVCKRGSVLRVSYNHNVLFSSTVDHAEERLIDGLFKDPSAFIDKSHARIFSDGQRVNIEDHMKHISVYTSLEPCQQCSGKLHIAEVPELVFCQRDWVSYSATPNTNIRIHSCFSPTQDIQLLQAQLYEKFRKCRSIPASNFEFTPYQELSSGYYNFQSDRRKTFFSLGDRKVASKTTMPYFLCTDYAQMIFRLGHEVFDKDLKFLFLGGDTWTADDTKKIQEFADKHGLISAHEWLKKAKNIRDYRPLLNRKQKRVLYDELCCSRTEWIQLYHKRECSVTMQFDSNSKVNEHEIERNFASLVDIKSIYLPRDLDGSLKGIATLVCSSPAAAKQFVALFKLSNDTEEEKKSHIEECLDDSGEIVIRQKSDLSKLRRDFLQKAAEWLYTNRRIQDEELFVPVDSPECSPQLTALLLEWHQRRNEIKTEQKRIKLQLDETEQKLRLVVARSGFNGRNSAVEALQDDKVMYIVLKNSNGPGCTLCTWIGAKTPVNQQNGSKKHSAQVQFFLKSSIRKLCVDRTQYKTKDDFQNPQASDVHGASGDEMDEDGAALQQLLKQLRIANMSADEQKQFITAQSEKPTNSSARF
jgi:tRNA(Arg) A34 adenosine deaminase TadA